MLKCLFVLIFNISCLLLFAQDSLKIDSLVQLSENSKIDTLKVKYNLEIVQLLYKSHPDSAILYLKEAHEIVKQKKLNEQMPDILLHYGNIYLVITDYQNSIRYYLKALSLRDSIRSIQPKNLKNLMGIADINNSIGILYFGINDFKKSLHYFNLSLNTLEDINAIDTAYESTYQRIKLLNNIGGIYLNSNEPDLALEYYKKGLEVNKNYGDERLNANLYNNIGIVYLEKKDYDFAFRYYMDAMKIREKLDLRDELVQSYNNLGKYYFLTGDNQNAELYLNKAMAITEITNVLKSKVITTQILTEVYAKQGRYLEALEMHKLYKALSDSLYNNESIEKMSRLEMEYEFMKNQKDIELEKEKEKVNNQRKEFIYIGITGIAFVSVIILTLLLYLSRNKTKQAQLEQANLQLEKEGLRKELEYKNKELTTNVMYLVKKNEFITSIAEKLIKSKIDFKKENQVLIQELIQELQQNTDDTIWKEFEIRFMAVHKEFYNKLNEKFPDLSPNEKKLCAFLRLNMSTKDISAITFQSPTTLDVARSRLRKKLGLDRDENLIAFLTSL